MSLSLPPLPPAAPPPSAPAELSTGAIVGLVFAGLGAAVISFGMIYLAKDACYGLICGMCESADGDDHKWWAANGSVLTVDSLSSEQQKRLLKLFADRATTGGRLGDACICLAREERHLTSAYLLFAALKVPLAEFDGQRFRGEIFDLAARDHESLFSIADRRRCGRVNFSDFCAIFVRLKVEGVKAVVLTAPTPPLVRAQSA